MGDKHKHLEFIEAVIARMAHHSFLIKGWTVTVLAALLALAATAKQVEFILPGFIVVLAFWWLDSFFLLTEKGYRTLYDKVRALPEEKIDFDMTTSKGELSRFNIAWSDTLRLFYLPLLVVLAVLTIVLITH